MRATVDISEPLHLDGDYTIKGRVLVLPITGEGKCSLRLGRCGGCEQGTGLLLRP